MKKDDKHQELIDHYAKKINSLASLGGTPRHMKVFYDAEFTSLTPCGRLISIGIVSESGSWFYAEFNDYDEHALSEWVFDNVWSNLLYNDRETYRVRTNVDGMYDDNQVLANGVVYSINMKGSSEQIKKDLLKWLKNEFNAHHIIDPTINQICFCVDAGHYDWVLLTSLLSDDGDGLSLPRIISYAPLDICSIMHFMGDFPLDMSREKLAGDSYTSKLKTVPPFNSRRFAKTTLKHNSLWDAVVLMFCYKRLMLK